MLAALLLAGCGQATDTPANRPSPTPAPTATASPAPGKVTITDPRPGTVVRAGRWIRVGGKAAPDTTVLLSAGCGKAGCDAIARARDDGRWRGVLRPRDSHTTIEASTISSGAVDRVSVRVRAPAREAVPVTPEAEPTVAPRPRPTRVVVVGDSLTVGIDTLLPPLLPEYRVSIDARSGRPLAEGMQIIGGTDVSGAVLAVGLFTNNAPQDVDALDAAVRQTVAAVGPDGCAVWATIVHPPAYGGTYRTANARLAALEAELSPRLILVPWAEAAASKPSIIGPDGVHGTPEGYSVRAHLYAEAIRSCGG